MSEQNRLQKLLEILTLLSGNVMYSMAEIAEKKEISLRSTYRYIETIENSGFVITRNGKRLKIDKENSHGKMLDDLLHFSKEEAFILSRAIHTIDEDNLIKGNLIKKLYSLYDFRRVANSILKKEQSTNVHLLIEAIESKKQVVLKEYESANSQSIKDRLVEPIEFTVNYTSLWCYEIESNSTKLFKTSRIKSVEISLKPCCFQNDYKIGHLDIFRFSGQQKIPVKLRMNLRAKNLLIEEYPLAEQYITPENENSYLFNGWICSFEGIGRFVMGLLDDIEIIDNHELSDFIKEKLKIFKF
jgi:predicted DNA-binding transcriptional regulator YafY